MVCANPFSERWNFCFSIGNYNFFGNIFDRDLADVVNRLPMILSPQLPMRDLPANFLVGRLGTWPMEKGR